MVQWLIQKFLRKLLDEVSRIGPKGILDLGCGEGIVARAILDENPGIAYEGYDRSTFAVEEARRRNPEGRFHCMDILGLAPEAVPDPDLVLCLEVMEHIADTGRFLATLTRFGGRHCIVSVPWEPFFRLGNLCRGLHVRRFGNHPEHVHCFGIDSFRRSVSRYFSQVRVERSFPWLFGICTGPVEEGRNHLDATVGHSVSFPVLDNRTLGTEQRGMSLGGAERERRLSKRR